MGAPFCPECDAPMVLRTARRGRNAGGQFFGCTKYPSCRGTRPYDPAEQDSSAYDAPPVVRNRLQLPRTLIARSLNENSHVRFIQSVPIPFEALQVVVDGNLGTDEQRAFSQWRLDFLSPRSAHPLNTAQRQILAVAEKLLTRGTLTTVSPSLEASLRELFNVAGSDQTWDEVVTSLSRHPACAEPLPITLDSQEELIFYDHLLPKLVGSACHSRILPQVQISSLIPGDSAEHLHQRCDFLICMPSVRVVVEIDGAQHQERRSLDNERDVVLIGHGYDVVRIPADEVRRGEGPALTRLRELLAVAPNVGADDALLDTAGQFVLALKVAHQIQFVLLNALQVGQIPFSSSWSVSTDLATLTCFTPNEAEVITRLAVKDLVSTMTRLASLYQESFPNDPDGALRIGFTRLTSIDSDTALVRDIAVPFDITHTSFAAPRAILESPHEDDLAFFLQYVFRKACFWEGQVDAISRILQGHDTIVLLPTGAGKSIAFQLASLLLPGRAVVIGPIISLIDDQLDNLRLSGITRCIGITSAIDDAEDRSEAIRLFGQGEYLLCYVAPERFQITSFRDSLRALTAHTPVALIAIDEAHCVSEWGHDFRTAYLNIGRTTREYCATDEVAPPLIALTGTASRAALNDVQRELQITDFDALITPRTFDRPELQYNIQFCSSEEKESRIQGILGQMIPSRFGVPPASFYQTRGDRTCSGLVFCPHVNGRLGVVEQSHEITKALRIPTSYYSGGAPKAVRRDEYEERKKRNAREFKRNHLLLLVCTKAFGMGIDKPNVRYTVHIGLPSSIEAFYQEAGRAGRDRNPALCCLVVSDDDPERTAHLLDPSTSVEEVVTLLDSTRWVDKDDITHALFFHVRAFRGVAAELEDIRSLLQRLGDISDRAIQTLRVDNASRQQVEKAVHRLLLLGVVRDYTINYAASEFRIALSGAAQDDIITSYSRYVSGYVRAKGDSEIAKARHLKGKSHQEFVLEMSQLLLDFVYRIIERGRRAALREMLAACRADPTDAGFRERILRHLEATAFSETLERILESEDVGLTEAQSVMAEIRSANDAAELRGQVARYLESYPDHPALLMLRCLAELYTRAPDEHAASQYYHACLKSLMSGYGVDQAMALAFLGWGLQRISTRSTSLAEDIVNDTLRTHPTRSIARMLISASAPTVSSRAAWCLLDQLGRRCQVLCRSGG